MPQLAPFLRQHPSLVGRDSRGMPQALDCPRSASPKPVAFSWGWGEALGCLQAGPGPTLCAPGARLPSLPCVAELTQHPDRLKVPLWGGGQGRGLFLPLEGPGSGGDPAMPEAASGLSRPDLWAPSRLFQVVSLGLTCPMADCCFLTCIQASQEAGKVVWYSHLFQNFLLL